MKMDIITNKLRLLPGVLFILLFLPANRIHAQSRITNTSIELKGNKIHVSYDIENSKRSDRYNVRLEVTDSTGNLVLVNSLEGDVGENIPGGNKKEIIWNLEADNIQMNADIYIELYADAVVEPEPEPPREELVQTEPETTESSEEQPAEQLPEPDLEEDSEAAGGKTMEAATEREFSRAGIILQSVALPGLGLSRVKGGPHWLKGVAGYGAVVGAVLMNNMAVGTYEDYKTPGSVEEAGSLLEKSMQQDMISEICAYTAIGIWVADMVWTIAGTSDLNNMQAVSDGRPVSIGTGFDPLSGVPLLAFRYKF